MDSSTGEITGIPKTPGISGIIVQVKDGNAFAATKQFSIAIEGLSCQTSPVVIEQTPPVPCNSIQTAYADALDGDVFQTQAVNHAGDLLFDRPVSITLKGGYDCDYTGSNYYSTLTGTMIIIEGTVILENIILE